MNIWTGIGNLTKDPELSPVGQNKVCKFGLAVNEGYGDKKRTSFLNCEAWNKTAELISSYCKKGNKVAIVGSLQQDSWTDKSGNKRRTLKVRVTSCDFLFSPEKSNVSALAIGDRVYSKEYGPDFEGQIMQVGKDKAKVKFDDGDEGVYVFGDLVYIGEPAKQEPDDDSIPF